MDPRHHAFAGADPFFYDHPSRRRARRSRPLLAAHHLRWDDWQHVDDGNWSFWRPQEVTLPDQGWKIHIAGVPRSAVHTVEVAAAYCHQNRIAFKHLTDLATVVAQVGKDAERSSSGKIVTIYPADEATLHRTLLELDAQLRGTPSPWILSDLRWEDGPLSVRYGAFEPAWLRDATGRKLHGIRHPHGELVEDRREAAFTPPPWIELPWFLRAQWERLGDGGKPAEFPYEVLRPLAYSNAGGTYLAREADGSLVVLKEARGHAGFTPDGRDAVARIRDEHARLIALAGDGLVGVRALLEVEDHVFLALEHVEGITLNRAMVSRSPTIRANGRPADYLAYREWALDIADQLRAVVERLHAAGFTHGDLHPDNVMVTPDDRVVLIDLEMSTSISDYASVEVGAAGFVPRDGRGGADADLYALASISLALFNPLTPLIQLDPDKIDDLLAHARISYALSDSWAHDVAEQLRPRTGRAQTPSAFARRAGDAIRRWDVGDEPAVSDLMALLGRSISASSDPARADRLWPGDPAQFAESPLSLAHGASGVIRALRHAGLEVDPLAMSWFDHATDAALQSAEPDLGLYDGLAGAALVHRSEGDDARADALLDRIRAHDLNRLTSDLYSGLPGIGLFLLSESLRRPELLDDSLRVAGELENRLGAVRAQHPGTDPLPGRVRASGLMWGATGTALFALRLYERTGRDEHLALAIDAIRHDLRYCLTGDDGSLQVDEGFRLMPYLASGTAGIGIALAQLLQHTDDDRLRVRLSAITRAASTPFTIQSGLFEGRAGLILFHVALARSGMSTPSARAALDDHVSSLRLHALRHGTGIAFPGAGLLRLSADLATGAAGVLSALDAYSRLAHDPQRSPDCALPFLLPSAAVVASTLHRSEPAEGRR